MAPRLKLRDIAFFERPVQFARPFRFGAITINATPQLFVRVEIEVEGRGTAVGASAELLVPKWFDKRPELSPAQTVDGLRRSLEIARGLYLARTGYLTAFDLHGIRAIDPWRDQVAAVGLDRTARAVRDAGLELSGYCRGGMADTPLSFVPASRGAAISTREAHPKRLSVSANL